jgi:putative FmdB family regulatory protein
MPIYAYRCENCGHAKDALQKLSDPVLTVCPACGEPALRKQVTAAGFQLKGSGWYVTDFRGDKNASGKATEGAGETAKADGNGATHGEAASKGDSASMPANGANGGSGASGAKSESGAKREKGAKADKAATAPTSAPAAAPAPAPAAPSGGAKP